MILLKIILSAGSAACKSGHDFSSSVMKIKILNQEKMTGSADGLATPALVTREVLFGLW